MDKVVVSCDSTEVERVALSDAEMTLREADIAAAVEERSKAALTETRRAQVRAKIEQRIAQAEEAYAKWDTLTQAQKNTVLKEVTLAVAKLGRLALEKFDISEG